MKVRGSLLSGCLQMMTTQTPHSTVKMTQGTTTDMTPFSRASRQLAKITHSMEIRMAARRTRGGRLESFISGVSSSLGFSRIYLQITAVVM